MSARPPKAQHVVLRLPDAAQPIPARVDGADDKVLTLVLSALPDASMARMRDTNAVVEYTTPRGIYRLAVEIEGQGDSPEILKLRRNGEDDVVQRRDFVRVEAVVPVQVTVTDPIRGAAHTTTLNLSGGGLLLLDPFGLDEGTELQLELEVVPGSAPILLCGRIVRDLGEDRKGIQIETITRDDQERLVRYVTERERIAMRVARGGG